MILFNQGNTPDRTGIIGGTLGDGVVGTLTIPVLDATYDTGAAIFDGARPVSLTAVTEIETRSTENVIADLAGVNPTTS